MYIWIALCAPVSIYVNFWLMPLVLRAKHGFKGAQSSYWQIRHLPTLILVAHYVVQETL